MSAQFWNDLGSIADLALAFGALYVTAQHLRAHHHDELEAKANDQEQKDKHADYAETLRKNASLSDPTKLWIIVAATATKSISALGKLWS